MRWLLLLSLYALATIAKPFFVTFPSDIDWVTRSSDHFDVLYRRDHDALAERALLAAERAHKLLTPIFPQSPPRTWILLADFSDNLNGYAFNMLLPHMVIYVAPPAPSSELAALDDWFSSIILHEYTHNLHLYPARGLWALLRGLFGSCILPNGLAPKHFHEGLATFMETEFSRGGRGRGTYFSMLRRTAVAKGVWGTETFQSIDRMDGTLDTYPHGTSAYFMGYQLYRELWDRQGAQGITDFVDGTSRLFPYFLNRPFEWVYQEDYSTIWDKIYLKTRLVDLASITRIQKAQLSNTEPITQTRFKKRDLSISPSGKRLLFRSESPNGGDELHLVELPEGKESSLKAVETLHFSGPEGICWDTSSSKALLTLQKNSLGYTQNFIQLFSLDSQTLVPIEFTGAQMEHTHLVACDDLLRTLVTFEESFGSGKVVRYFMDKDQQNLKKDREWTVPTGQWVSGIAVHKDSVTFSVRRGIQTDFYRWVGDAPTLFQTADGYFYNLRRLDGEAVLAIGTPDDRDEIYIVDPVRNTLQKHAAFLTGVSSFDWNNKDLYALVYHHGGYDLEKVTPISESSRKLSGAKLPDSPEFQNGPVCEPKEYSPISTLGPTTWLPMGLLVPNGLQMAVRIPGADISQRHYYDLMAGYDTRGSGLGSILYGYRFNNKQLNFGGYLAPSYFFISNTPELFSRNGLHTGIDFSWDSMRWGFSLLASRLALPTSDALRSFSGRVFDSIGSGISAQYSTGFTNRRPALISPRSGTLIAAAVNYYPTAMGSTDEYAVATARVDQFLPSFVSSHSLYTSVRAGWTHGTPVVNSFFEVGGEILFAPSRPTFFNRGFVPIRFAAREVINANLEYRFPLLHVERGWGLFPLRLRQVHAALVTDISTVDISADGQYRDRLFQDYYQSIGIELKADWIGSYYFPSQFRVGLYHGFGDAGKPVYVSMALDVSI